jgi:hypothetical protein
MCVCVCVCVCVHVRVTVCVCLCLPVPVSLSLQLRPCLWPPCGWVQAGKRLVYKAYPGQFHGYCILPPPIAPDNCFYEVMRCVPFGGTSALSLALAFAARVPTTAWWRRGCSYLINGTVPAGAQTNF